MRKWKCSHCGYIYDEAIRKALDSPPASLIEVMVGPNIYIKADHLV